ncbi:MAG: glycoside hydrolase family 15 protein [Bacteroidales bacterium]|nr:glycoside hydrolase family 15 protein [Bacteroidales bacterium]
MQNLNYGIIGNCRSAALISQTGSIDWLCLPKFDSPSVFAKILDREKGGSFEFIFDDSYSLSQSYICRTNILVTKVRNPDHEFEIVDFMPRYIEESGTHYVPPDIIRYIKYQKGKPAFRIKYNPCLEYAKYPTKTIVNKDYIKSYTTKGPYDSVYLYTDLDKKKVLNGELLEITGDAYFLLSYNQKILTQTVDREYLKLQRTKVYWLNWSERTKLYGRYNDEILRSALVLKLLSYDNSGAILAAVTTSLPETPGDIRNWDYRFCWLRDSSMVIKVMSELGHSHLARRYLNFIRQIIPDKDEKIQIMYGINGERTLTEQKLDHFAGYKNSKPVRIGNDAYKQKQNDIFGILMDAIYQQFNLFDVSLENSEDLWTITRSIVKMVGNNWKKPDRGIWEIRKKQQHFTFSKVLCWVAIDRAIKISRIIKQHGLMNEWEKLKEIIRKDVFEKAWNKKLKAFTQVYHSSDLDASVLLMEPFGFIGATDPRYISTVKAIRKHLSHNGLLYRYKNMDDFGIPSSAFVICTFWLINSLHKIGEKKEAEKLFDQMLTYSNHLGLYSEDIDFDNKQLLGNFPQAYSHLALIETAINLSGGTLSPEGKLRQIFVLRKS